MEKRKSTIVYTITLDRETRLPVELLETVVAIARPDVLSGAPEQYYVFSTKYQISSFGEIERFSVPTQARDLLR